MGGGGPRSGKREYKTAHGMAFRRHTAWVDETTLQSKNTQITPIIYCMHNSEYGGEA